MQDTSVLDNSLSGHLFFILKMDITPPAFAVKTNLRKYP